MNIAHMLEWSAIRHADRPAMVAGDDVVFTYADLDRAANRLANGLSGLGVEKGDRVGILIGNQVEYFIAEAAVVKAGGVRVPMLIRSSAEEVAHYVSFSDAIAVIASEEGLDTLRRLDLERRPIVVALSGAKADEVDYQTLVESSSSDRPGVDLVEQDHYAIRFTGGTTGAPKGVLMSHGTMVTVVNNMLLNWPVTRDDVVCHFHPLSHAAGMLMYAWHVRGAKQVILPAFNFDADVLLQKIEQHRVTTLFLIPTVINVLLDSDDLTKYDISSLHTMIYGGAPISLQRIREALDAFGPSLVQIYGSSEAPNVLTTLSRDEHEFVGEPPPRLRSAGRVALGVELRVVDSEGRDCRPGEIGEVVSRGPHTMVGYWKNADLTRERMVEGWVHTRDMATFDEDGYLYIVDRKDDMIISGGFNVWPAEVEEAVYRHPAVREVAAFGVEDPKWGEAVVAAVTLEDGASVSEDELRVFVQVILARHKVPKRVWIRANDIPRSAVGKPLRRAVAEEYRQAHGHEAG